MFDVLSFVSGRHFHDLSFRQLYCHLVHVTSFFVRQINIQDLNHFLHPTLYDPLYFKTLLVSRLSALFPWSKINLCFVLSSIGHLWIPLPASVAALTITFTTVTTLTLGTTAIWVWAAAYERTLTNVWNSIIVGLVYWVIGPPSSPVLLLPCRVVVRGLFPHHLDFSFQSSILYSEQVAAPLLAFEFLF